MRKLVMASVITVLAAAIGVSAALASGFTDQELAYMPAARLLELFKSGEATPSQELY